MRRGFSSWQALELSPPSGTFRFGPSSDVILASKILTARTLFRALAHVTMFVEVSCASSVETVLIVRDSGAGADFDLMAIGEKERERETRHKEGTVQGCADPISFCWI